MESIAANLEAIQARIEAACVAAGRARDSVRLLPVSKTRPISDLEVAIASGYTRFGENKAQDLEAKALELAHVRGLEWVMIGHLQSNKAKIVARHASEFQALDSVPLAAELDRRLQPLGRRLDVLIQVNSSGEESKFGLPPDEVVDFARQLTTFDALRVRGLMTLAAPSPVQRLVKACFTRMQHVQALLREAGIDGQRYGELSMGMSSDFELAIAHGATQVRIGTGIFGARDYGPHDDRDGDRE
ncbi:MAG TPA: YggS family pyridoxal phosphate-dependent enzyme [Propionicimonas sp.]|nr:YggS family pyridoxal phosphate-dependent enzyme [Propionicimonas sp.]HRA06384.1 YggS family pyridoxal phosphate-dependent enzyme [Propionicimonas sp.]